MRFVWHGSCIILKKYNVLVLSAIIRNRNDSSEYFLLQKWLGDYNEYWYVSVKKKKKKKKKKRKKNLHSFFSGVLDHTLFLQ